MGQIKTDITAVKRLELKLAKQSHPKQRIVILDQLAGHYVFTNYREAQKLLTEEKEILEHHSDPDYQLNYHINKAFIENQLYNFYLSEIHAKLAIEILEERGDVKQQAEAYIDYAGTCINLDEKELANTYLDKAAKLLDAFPDARLQARITCREGFLNLHYKNYAKAIELLLEADKSINGLPGALTLKDYYFKTLIYSGLGKIYERNDDIEKSVRAYLKVVDWCESLGMRTRLSWHYLNVGNGFMALEDDRSAKQYFRKAIKIDDDVSQNARAAALANLGFCSFKNEKYDEAMVLYNRAEKLYREKSARDYSNLSVIESRKAQLCARTGKKKKAQKHFVNALEYGQRNDDFKQLASVCKEIATYYADMDDYKNAYEYQVLHDEMTERYMEEVNHRMMMELEVKYEAEKKKQEAELLRLHATGLQLKALRAQMNPHFLFNALNSIQNYITSDQTGDAAKYLAKFALLMRQSLEYSDMEIISLEKEIEFLENYLFINQKLRFYNQLEYRITVDDELEEDIMGVPTMIVQPYVENAIEHGVRSVKDGLVKLEFYLHDENTLLCVVEDNGIGRAKAAKRKMRDPQLRKHESKGTAITEERLKILNKSKHKGVMVKTIDLEDEYSGRPNGTRVEILIPIEIIQKLQPMDN
ncbi:MAG: histidine kinase [Bacteroidota bacterium]